MSRTKLLGSMFIVVCCSCGEGDAGDTLSVQQGALATPSPAVVNGSFEDDGTGVASPVGWVSSGSVNADFTEFGGHTGSLRLSHWSAEAYSVDTAQTVSGLADGWYTLRAWVRRSTGRNNSYVELACGRDPERVYLPVSWPDQWLHVVVSARVTDGSCTVTLHTDGDARRMVELRRRGARSRGAAKLSVLGADVSSLKKSEDLGGVYRDERGRRGSTRWTILEDHGAQPHPPARLGEPRRRLPRPSAECWRWRGARKRAGPRGCWSISTTPTPGPIPAHQTKPAAWASYTVRAAPAGRLRPHLRRAAGALKAQGTGPT